MSRYYVTEHHWDWGSRQGAYRKPICRVKVVVRNQNRVQGDKCTCRHRRSWIHTNSESRNETQAYRIGYREDQAHKTIKKRRFRHLRENQSDRMLGMQKESSKLARLVK